MPRKFFSSACLMTGTISPQSSATAMPMLMFLLYRIASPSIDRVHDRVLAQRDDHRPRDERHVGQLHAVALLVLRLLLLAQPHDLRHVHLEDGVHMRAGLLRLDHALRDDRAHLRHRHQLAGQRSGRWRRSLAPAAAVQQRERLQQSALQPPRLLQIAPRISSLVIRPAEPVPATWLRSTLFSLAILRTSGEERTRSPSRPARRSCRPCRSCGGLGAAAAGAAAGCCRRGCRSLARRRPPITATTVLT